jgi:radical SAM protein with 4Fe4S-binding SPASM domain
MMLYLKTTETCQLNCSHCFTNGILGKKGWFDEVATNNFLTRLSKFSGSHTNVTLIWHGGEPLLCPVDKMMSVFKHANGLWDNINWALQTNLTYKLDDDKMQVLNDICGKSWGTSYDEGIRWSVPAQKHLWETNLRSLTDDGHEVTLVVCLDKKMMARDLKDFFDYVLSLGVKYIQLERITENGSAAKNNSIIPSNEEIDQYLFDFYNMAVETGFYKEVGQLFFNSLLTSIVYNTHMGCRARSCEQKILTINADGTVGGCPNGAVDEAYGTIHDDVLDLLTSEKRMCNIAHESIRPEPCMVCPVFDICNSDCHQLVWQGDICAAPKKLMQKFKDENDIEFYKEFLQGMKGIE